MKKFGIFAIAAAFAALGAFAEIERNTNSYVRAGVTYAQRGGMDAKTYVVTNVDMTADDVGAVDATTVSNISFDVAAQMTNALNAVKRDLDDLAVYKLVKSAFVLHKDGLTDVTLPFVEKGQGKPYPYNEYDWVFKNEGSTWFHAIVFSDGQWKLNVDDGMEYGYSPASEDALRIEFDNGYVATRSSIMSTAHVDDQKLAAVATGDAQTPANGDLVKYDASNDRFVKATAGTDYVKDISGKMDKVNSASHGFLVADENGNAKPSSLVDEITIGEMQLSLQNKADRATTLSGYGITDAYTKTEVVPLWVAGHVYNAGDTVLYNGAYYRAMFDGTSSSPDKTFSYWEPITFENVDVYGGLSVHTGDLSVDNGELELSGGGITVNSGFEIKRGNDKVVYGISVNGGAAQHGDVSIDVPTPGNYSAVSNAAMWASNEVASIHISAANPTFSNAVLAVGLNIDTNTVAVLNEIASTFGDFPITGTATTVGGLLAALAAAIAWLKKNALVGGLTGGVPDDPKVHDFFTESNSLLNGRLAYSRNATGLKDRAFNTLSFDGTEYNLSTALAAVTPTASGQPRDLLIVATATAATTISFTAGTIKGDKPTIDGSGTWLITLTEYASGVWYCRQIKMEDAA